MLHAHGVINIVMTADELLDAFDAAWAAVQQQGGVANAPDLTEFLLSKDNPEAQLHREHLKEIDREFRLRTVLTPTSQSGSHRAGIHPVGRTSVERFPELPGFTLECVVGRGGKGIVFRAVQQSVQRTVAIKTLTPEYNASALNLERLRNEARILGSLKHPHLVTVYSLEEHQHQLFLVMEYVHGSDLSEHSRHGNISCSDAARYIMTAAEAIQAAHAAHVLHRDIKPSNILLDRDGVIRVTDFGLSRQNDPAEHSPSLTATVEVLGTPGYIAPEQAAGRNKDLRETADVYGLGATLFHLLTGRPPFVGDSVLEVLIQVQNADPPAPRLLKPGIPLQLEIICLKCLEKNPMHRYPSAQDLADDLNRFLNGEPIHARPVSRATKLIRWCRKHPGTASLLTTIVLLLGLSVGLLIDRNARVSKDLTTVSGRNQELQSELKRAADEMVYFSLIRRAVSEYEANRLGSVQEILEQTSPQDNDGPPPWEWAWLNGLLHAELHSFSIAAENAEWVGALAFSPDGTKLAAGPSVPLYKDRRRGTSVNLVVYDLRSGKQIAKPGPTFSIVDLAFNSDGRTLYAAESDMGYDPSTNVYYGPGRIRQWNTESWEESPSLADCQSLGNFILTPANEFVTIDGYDAPERGLNITSDAGGADGLTRYAAWQPSPLFQGFLCHDDSSVAHEIRVRDAFTIHTGTRKLPVLELHAAGYQIRSEVKQGGINRATLYVSSKPNGRLLQTIPFPSVETMAVDASERWLAIATNGGEIRIWDMESWSETACLRGHQARIRSMAFSPDGRLLASGDWDGNIRIWDPARASSYADTLAPQRATSVEAFGLTEDGQLVAWIPGQPLRHLKIGEQDSASSVELLSSQALIAPGRQADISADGRLIALFSPADETVAEIRDAKTGSLILQLSAHSSRLSYIQIFNELIATASWPPADPADPHNHHHEHSAEIRLSRENGTALFFESEPRARIFRIAMTHDAQTISAAVMRYELDGSQSNAVRTWDVGTGNLIDEFPMSSWVLALEYASDGRLFAIDFYDGDLVVRDPRKHETVQSKPGFAPEIQELSFSPDEQRLAGVTRSRVSLWNPRTLQNVIDLPLTTYESDYVFTPRVRFSVDGMRLLAGQVDGTVRTWTAMPR